MRKQLYETDIYLVNECNPGSQDSYLVDLRIKIGSIKFRKAIGNFILPIFKLFFFI